jgi:hypothetical protein
MRTEAIRILQNMEKECDIPDGSVDGMEKTMKQIQALMVKEAGS